HFFDNIDFSDARMLRTPLYDAKVNKFMNRITIRHPDSLKFAAARVIDKSLSDTQLFKYTLIKLFNKYAQSKYMGMDEVFVHLAERYYLSGLAYWSDSTQLAKIWDRVAKLSNNIIGMKAKELVMKDTSGTYHSIFDTYSEYSVLIFWDYDCGHCRKVLPILKKYYNKTDRDSLEVFAIFLGTDLKQWKDYVNENNFNWINLSDPGNSTNFRVLYDIHSSPVIYLLNKNHIIEAKRISVKDIKEIINTLEKRKKANRKKEE
ncbi:MAG: thioredoxin-like domain-containing protein, partial [Bacteroidota bacterium]|nr:thioredoxin-like domain-containing protein [Bacteroidota bacterium]